MLKLTFSRGIFQDKLPKQTPEIPVKFFGQLNLYTMDRMGLIEP